MLVYFYNPFSLNINELVDDGWEEWESNFFWSMYRVIIAGAMFTRAYMEPFIAARKENDNAFLNALSTSTHFLDRAWMNSLQSLTTISRKSAVILCTISTLIWRHAARQIKILDPSLELSRSIWSKTERREDPARLTAWAIQGTATRSMIFCARWQLLNSTPHDFHNSETMLNNSTSLTTKLANGQEHFPVGTGQSIHLLHGRLPVSIVDFNPIGAVWIIDVILLAPFKSRKLPCRLTSETLGICPSLQDPRVHQLHTLISATTFAELRPLLRLRVWRDSLRSRWINISDCALRISVGRLGGMRARVRIWVLLNLRSSHLDLLNVDLNCFDRCLKEAVDRN